MLRSAAREALSGSDWLAAARGALDGGDPPAGWPVAVTAGWPGLLLGEAAGGAGLGAAEALLVLRELGRSLAGVPLLGHLVATERLGSGTPAGEAITDLASLAGGQRRAAWLPARPEEGGGRSVDPLVGRNRPAGARVDDRGRVSGSFGWVPDAADADLLVAGATDPAGREWTVLIDAHDARIDEIAGYDPSRRLAHVRLERATATRMAAPSDAAERCWALAQALLGAESLGAAERLLEMSVEHARTRSAFGRAIGSFQAIKHQLVEVLRRVENARALAGRAGEALASDEGDAYTVACSLRFSAGDALDFASRTAIAVHGGVGATWEHPAGLYFRRAQVTRRLLGGHRAAAAEVGRRLLTPM